MLLNRHYIRLEQRLSLIEREMDQLSAKGALEKHEALAQIGRAHV